MTEPLVDDSGWLASAANATPTPEPLRYVKIGDVAKHFGVSWHTVWRACVRGAVPAKRFGRGWRIEARVLDAGYTLP